MTTVTVILIVLAAIIISSAVASFVTSKKMRAKVTYMLDALEDKELNFRFDERRLRGRKFNRTLNRLRNIFDKERHEIIEQEKYFGLMLDHVKTGIAVIEKDGRVAYCNNTALHLLGIATFGHIRQLRAVSDSLYESFQTIADGNEERASYYNESGKMTISLTASEAKIGKDTVRIIAFNDISSEIAENEQQSWSKLIRVLTHEIMNTITPIASLSDTLVGFDDISGEIKNGLSTISESSKGLIKFVDSYRNLTRVAPPVKKAFYFRELAERVISLTREQAVISGTVCTYEELSEDIILYADEGQITQILINLVKNAVQAEAKNIGITAEINPSEHIIINVTNDGHPISKESQDEIFVPFFTTKQEGTGIGLSLSRQIMRLHNGTLSLTRSDASSTVFTLIFR
ncbi:MAG: PAS domain-containing sensor histidine kinase [Bacteroidales bacterium]|nr:PAS domain-containing sensor histidine kinase [Bacteroidales bacterium]